MRRPWVRQLSVVLALGAGLAALPAGAHADEDARLCQPLPVSAKLPARTADTEDVDCFLEDIGATSSETIEQITSEVRNCPTEDVEDHPYLEAEQEAAILQTTITQVRAAHERTYATIDSYLGSKRTYYQAKYFHTPATRLKVDDQLNLIGAKVKAFRDDERAFFDELQAEASQLSAHDCSGAAQTVGRMNSTITDLRTIEGPEVGRAFDKLLVLIKLPARKTPAQKEREKAAKDKAKAEKETQAKVDQAMGKGKGGGKKH